MSFFGAKYDRKSSVPAEEMSILAPRVHTLLAGTESLCAVELRRIKRR